MVQKYGDEHVVVAQVVDNAGASQYPMGHVVSVEEAATTTGGVPATFMPPQQQQEKSRPARMLEQVSRVVGLAIV